VSGRKERVRDSDGEAGTLRRLVLLCVGVRDRDRDSGFGRLHVMCAD